MEKLCLRSATASDDVILQPSNPNTVHLCVITLTDTFHLCFLISTHENWHSLADWAARVFASVIILIQDRAGNHITATWQSDYNTVDPKHRQQSEWINRETYPYSRSHTHTHTARGQDPPSTNDGVDLDFFLNHMQDSFISFTIDI